MEVEVIPLSTLRVPTPKREELRSVEASLRLDAIASAGKWVDQCWLTVAANKWDTSPLLSLYF